MSSYDIVPYLWPLAQYFLYFSVQLFKVHMSVCNLPNQGNSETLTDRNSNKHPSEHKHARSLHKARDSRIHLRGIGNF